MLDSEPPLDSNMASSSDQHTRDTEMSIGQVMCLVDQWVCKIEEAMQDLESSDHEDNQWIEAWDDVHGGELPIKEVEAARKEEVGYMQSRSIWREVPIQDCWDKTGKDPVSVRWVDVNKGGEDRMEVRSRLVARDFKGGDKDRDDLLRQHRLWKPRGCS